LAKATIQPCFLTPSLLSLPEEVQLVRAQAILTKMDGTRKLDFNKLTRSDMPLAIRFLGRASAADDAGSNPQAHPRLILTQN